MHFYISISTLDRLKMFSMYLEGNRRVPEIMTEELHAALEAAGSYNT